MGKAKRQINNKSREVKLTPGMAKLEELRVQLLRLHQILLNDERDAYAKVHGPVESPSKLLSLAMSDPWFDWLHKISMMIIRIDEISEGDQELAQPVSEIRSQAKSMFIATNNDSEFITRYKAVLQRNSAAVLAHAEVLRALNDLSDLSD